VLASGNAKPVHCCCVDPTLIIRCQPFPVFCHDKSKGRANKNLYYSGI
jgi:hypothetical protein